MCWCRYSYSSPRQSSSTKIWVVLFHTPWRLVPVSSAFERQLLRHASADRPTWFWSFGNRRIPSPGTIVSRGFEALRFEVDVAFAHEYCETNFSLACFFVSLYLLIVKLSAMQQPQFQAEENFKGQNVIQLKLPVLQYLVRKRLAGVDGAVFSTTLSLWQLTITKSSNRLTIYYLLFDDYNAKQLISFSVLHIMSISCDFFLRLASFFCHLTKAVGLSIENAELYGGSL